MTHLFLDSLIHWYMDWLIHWIIGSLVRWFTQHWFTDSLIRCCIDSLVRWFLGSLIHCFIGLAIPWFIVSWTFIVIHPFIGSLIYRPIGSLIHSVSCACILPCHVISISITFWSLVDALHKNNTWLLPHFKDFPIGHALRSFTMFHLVFTCWQFFECKWHWHWAIHSAMHYTLSPLRSAVVCGCLSETCFCSRALGIAT